MYSTSNIKNNTNQYKAIVSYDHYFEDPRENLSIISKINLDIKDYSLKEIVNPLDIMEDHEDRLYIQDIIEHIESREELAFAARIDVYQQSAYCLSIKKFSSSLDDQFDSSVAGVIVITKQQALEYGYNPNDEKVMRSLAEQELKEVQNYINGEAFEVTVFKTNCHCNEPETCCNAEQVDYQSGFTSYQQAEEYSEMIIKCFN